MQAIFSLQEDLGYALIIIAVVGFLHNLSVAVWAASKLGPMGAMGNRSDLPPEEGWALRARRGLSNFMENAVLFFALSVASLALTQHTHPEAVGLGALIFAIGRAFYLPVYLIGIPFLRSITWLMSMVGLGLMAWGLVG